MYLLYNDKNILWILISELTTNIKTTSTVCVPSKYIVANR